MLNPFKRKVVTGPLPSQTIDELCIAAEHELAGLPSIRIHFRAEIENLNFQHSMPGEEIACTRELGEAALVLLSRTLTHEVAWLYSDGVWRFIAIGDSDQVSITGGDYYKYFTEAHPGKPYAHYHTHPFHATKGIFSRMATTPTGPSHADFAARDVPAAIGEAFDRLGIPRPSFHRVADSFGIWEYGINKEMESKLLRVKSPSLSYDRKQMVRWASPEKYILQLLRAASKEGVQLSYIPILLK